MEVRTAALVDAHARFEELRVIGLTGQKDAREIGLPRKVQPYVGASPDRTAEGVDERLIWGARLKIGRACPEYSPNPHGRGQFLAKNKSRAPEVRLSGALDSISVSFVRDPAYMSPRPLGYQ